MERGGGMPGGRATGSTGPTGSAGSTGLRAAVERWSAAPVVFLHRLPTWVLLVAVFALLVLGMAGTGVPAAAGLFVLALFLGWFAYLNWPALDASGRLLRVVAVTALAGFGVARILGRF
ncbi:DUF6703 family protein [Actinomadura sp. WMMB 499]|uniref:DUF6703 family protein n=1 Tax=Actinomadura sp. WMMB 499 TaxID=1219491 RepID=UPI0012463B45|nr:DUF6703 family protein [Actinomadura sp. WMMB 499]QFG25682.1 hypothetical protein F7P10_35600 [Actinomadura sp. WMMB 499]